MSVEIYKMWVGGEERKGSAEQSVRMPHYET